MSAFAYRRLRAAYRVAIAARRKRIGRRPIAARKNDVELEDNDV